MYEKTPEEKQAFERFCAELDDRYFRIEPTMEVFRGSAQGAKDRAREILARPEVQFVRVTNTEGTVWFQRKD